MKAIQSKPPEKGSNILLIDIFLLILDLDVVSVGVETEF